MKRTLVATVTLTLIATACSSNGTAISGGTASSDAGTSNRTVTAKLTEFAFIMPETIPAGTTTLHVENVGGMPHFIDFSRIARSKTDEDIAAYLADPASLQGPPPTWVKDVGFPDVGLLSSGTSTDVTVNIPEGRYAVFCWMPDADGQPHAMLGMHAVFDAVADGETTTDRAPADLSVTATEGIPGVPAAIPEGPVTIGIRTTAGSRATSASPGSSSMRQPANRTRWSTLGSAADMRATRRSSP